VREEATVYYDASNESCPISSKTIDSGLEFSLIA